MRAPETTTSAITALRQQVPPRPLTGSETRQIIERQATRLLRLCEVEGPPVPIEELANGLPRIIVQRADGLPSSGRAQWSGQQWVLLVDSGEPKVRQRYSIAHELAHVIWHPFANQALPPTSKVSHTARLERACEFFAASLLMPRPWMKRAYFDEGIRDVPSLARFFGVSWLAMQVRLEQLGFVSWPETRTRKKEPA